MRKSKLRKQKPAHVLPVVVSAPASAPTRIPVKYNGADFFACPNAMDRALKCGQRVSLFDSPHCDEPTHHVAGAYFQVAQLAA